MRLRLLAPMLMLGFATGCGHIEPIKVLPSQPICPGIPTPPADLMQMLDQPSWLLPAT
jgi:hypothetical protein